MTSSTGGHAGGYDMRPIDGMPQAIEPPLGPQPVVIATPVQQSMGYQQHLPFAQMDSEAQLQAALRISRGPANADGTDDEQLQQALRASAAHTQPPVRPDDPFPRA